MNKIERIWSDSLPSFPAHDMEQIRAAADVRYFEVSACFWLFRFLHRFEDAMAALMGDYCFGRFSHHLAALDSVALTDAFSDWLKADTLKEMGIGEFLAFIAEIPMAIKDEYQ